MSFTLGALIAAAAPVALEAIGNYAKENKALFNGFLKQSKPVIFDVSKKASDTLDDELHKYENNGWDKDKKR